MDKGSDEEDDYKIKAQEEHEDRKREREEEVEERGEAEVAADRALVNYVSSAWIFELIPGRLYCGPRPQQRNEGLYLTQELHVTHIVNIQPHTDAKSDTWYTCWWDKFRPCNQPRVLRDFKIPTSTVRTMKDPTPVYVQAARDVVVPLMLSNTDAVVYIHNFLGYEEEATLALLVWLLVDPGSFPVDLPAWFESANRRRLLDDLDHREQLTDAVEAIKAAAVVGASAKKTSSMDAFVTRTKRP